MSAPYPALTLSQAALALCAIERPAILTHKNPDGDTVGCAAALCAFFDACGRAPVYMSEQPIPERLAFLVQNCTRAEVLPEGYTPIAVDVASTAQLGDLVDLLAHTPVALTIDHHRVSVPFAPTLCMPDACSAGEVLVHLFSHIGATGGQAMTTAMAYALYAAISSDTGSFRYANTTSETHRMTAELLAFPFDHADIDRRLFDTKAHAQLRAEGLTASLLQCEGPITYAVLDRATCEAHGLSYEDLDTAIDIVRSLRGTAVAIVAKETDTGLTKLSLRSTAADVAAVAARFRGGGHKLAAGCTLQDKPAQAMRLVLDAVHEVCEL